MSKNALVYFQIDTDRTDSDFVKNDYDEIVKYSVPTFENYCKKYDIDLVKITTKKWGFEPRNWYNYQMYEKNQMGDLFDKYDRILRIDADFLIRSCAPNIFDIVDPAYIGAVYEDSFGKCNNRQAQVEMSQAILGNLYWSTGYLNAGMVVASKSHRPLFDLTDHDVEFILSQQGADGKESHKLHKYPSGRPVFSEQTFFNYKLRKFNCLVQPLSFMFNHSVFFKRELQDYESSGIRHKYLDSFFLHYSAYSNRLAQMSCDSLTVNNEWKRDNHIREVLDRFGGRGGLKKQNKHDLARLFPEAYSTSSDSVSFEGVHGTVRHMDEIQEGILKSMDLAYAMNTKIIYDGLGRFTIRFADKFAARQYIEGRA